jgi:hypothetical protein
MRQMTFAFFLIGWIQKQNIWQRISQVTVVTKIY